MVGRLSVRICILHHHTKHEETGNKCSFRINGTDYRLGVVAKSALANLCETGFPRT